MCCSIPLTPLNGQFGSVTLQNSSKVILKVSSSVFFSSHEDFPNLRTDLHSSNQSPCFTATLIHAHCIHWPRIYYPLCSMALLSVIQSATEISCHKMGRNHCVSRSQSHVIMCNRWNGWWKKVMCHGRDAEEEG